MRITHRVMVLGAVLAVSLSATAATVTETGLGYMHQDTFETTPTSDGLLVANDSAHGTFVVEGMPEGFQSVIKGSCKGTWLVDPQFTNHGSAWICTATDNDGDGFINAGSAQAPDWSDCSLTVISSWGKYAGMTGSGKCQPLGNFGGQGTSIYSWTTEWTVPD